MDIPTFPLILALLFSAHGWRKGSLSASGAVTAFVVGLLMMAGGTSVFGVALIGFYLVGSRATKYGKGIKSRLEDGYREGGNRSGWQVVSNSLAALFGAVLWNAAFAPSSVQATVWGLFRVYILGRDSHIGGTAVADGTWCVLSKTVADGWSRRLILSALGHFACCLGDTLASELGILARSPPRLITTFRRVPRGTNGGVTAFGTAVSVVGGGMIGLLVGTTLIAENGGCRIEWRGVVMDSLMWGLIGGGLGSTVCGRADRQVYTDGGPAGLVAWGYGAAEPVLARAEGGSAGREPGRRGAGDQRGGAADEQPGESGVERRLCWDRGLVGRVMAERDDVICVDSQNRPDLDMKNLTITHQSAMSSSDEKRDVRSPILFECAWEVANKVGGIYTVIKTKVPVTVQEFGDRYCLIGPLSYKTAPMEVEPEEPTDEHFLASLHTMRSQGIKVLYGRWLIEGNPRVLLFDTGSAYSRLDEWKGDLWNLAGIPTPPNDHETNETIVFGYLVAWFLGDYVSRQLSTAVIAHFHEWQAGLAIPLCRKRHIDVTTVFTTHATLLGRYLCAGSVDFYNNLQYFDVDHEAGKRGIYHRYCIERSATHCADVFTTVSHITAYESEHLLKRKPDGVLPNGLNVVKFQAIHEFQNLHATSKAKINEFVRGHFYGHYDFDLNNTLYCFTAGRYEYRNKGVDMFIESLARLNYQLQKAGSNVTVVAFVIMPAATHSYTIEALKGQAVTKQLRDTVTEIQNRIGARLFDHAARFHGEEKLMPSPEELLPEEDQVLLKRRIFALKRNSLPPVVTHNMADDPNDPILNQIRRVKLFNHSNDRVKIIFHPDFLNSNNPILGLDYEEFVRGCHLGVFPSYYEPWGYTPAECTVMGIPSITTNLSGFGCFMQDLIERPEEEGCYIIDRRMQSVEDSVSQLSDFMFKFTQKTRRQRINQRNRVERLSPLLDWKNLGIEYSKARQLALRRAYPDAFYGHEGDELYEFGEVDYFGGIERTKLGSMPASPRLKGIATPGDLGTLTEDMQHLNTSDYRGHSWPEHDEDDSYPFPLVMKVRSRSGSVMSGASTPGGGAFRMLSEGDLRKADAALSQVNGDIHSQ